MRNPFSKTVILFAATIVTLAGIAVAGPSSGPVLFVARGLTSGGFGGDSKIGVPISPPGLLQNPYLQIFDGSGQLIASNDDVSSPPPANLTLNPTDAAIQLSLGAGTYTAVVTGVGGTTGYGGVDIFDADGPIHDR